MNFDPFAYFVVLASASPRRAELLRAAGIDFEVLAAEVDETPLPGESAEAHVRRLAQTKALAVVDRAGHHPVLGADTVVVIESVILGKPADADDARRMLRMLSGRTHEVVTGVTLVVDGAVEEGGARRLITEVESTAVEFAPLSEAEVDWYVGTGEPADKAGAYAVQGLASRFVTRIEGSYSNVVGLPVSLVYRMLTKNSGILQASSPDTSR